MGSQDQVSEHIMTTIFGSIPFVLICSVLTIVYRTIQGRERFHTNEMVQKYLYHESLLKFVLSI